MARCELEVFAPGRWVAGRYEEGAWVRCEWRPVWRTGTGRGVCEECAAWALEAEFAFPGGIQSYGWVERPDDPVAICFWMTRAVRARMNEAAAAAGLRQGVWLRETITAVLLRRQQEQTGGDERVGVGGGG